MIRLLHFGKGAMRTGKIDPILDVGRTGVVVAVQALVPTIVSKRVTPDLLVAPAE